MEKEFVSYEMALALKELGFDEPCFTYYYNISSKLRTNISIDIDDIWIPGSIKKLGITLAPTFSQAFRFFRDKYKIPSWVYTSDNEKFFFGILRDTRFYIDGSKPYDIYETYEEAELACLQNLIEMVINKNMQRIKVDPTKAIDGIPIMRKETGIEYLADIYDDEDFARPDVFRTAYYKQLDSIDEFSLWLVNEDWMPNYGSGLDRGKWERMGDDLKTMSELYQIFLEQNKKQNEY